MARRGAEKVFNSLESGNFGLGRRPRVRVIAGSLTAIRQIMIYLTPWFTSPPRPMWFISRLIFLAACSMLIPGFGTAPFGLSLDWKRIRFNSAACGQLKKCETDSLIGKVVWEVKNWEIEFGSERYNFEAAWGRRFEASKASGKQEAEAQWGFLAFIFSCSDFLEKVF